MHNFDFHRPASVADAVAALAQEDAQALSGGQTLIPTLKSRLAAPSALISLTGIAGMVGIEDQGSALKIGAATTHAAVAAGAAARFPALAALANRIGDPAVRNRGTVGGSLANNDPAACYPSAALATGATIHTDKRDIAADDYFQGMFTTALDEGEIITAVTFPIATRANYQKFLQPASRFALTGVFVAQYPSGTRVAVTGASEDGVFRWSDAEAALSQSYTADALDAVSPPQNPMINDLHGTPKYRAHLTKTLTKRAVEAS